MHVHITLIGLDRISASLALALKRYQKQPKAEHTFTIMGSDAKTQPMKDAEKIGAVDKFNRSLDKALENADLVVLNSPYGQLEEQYPRLGAALKPGAVVLDLSALKQPGIAWARQHFPRNAQGEPLAHLVGLTPVVSIAGLYTSPLEVETARADLFDKSEILVVADAKCPGEAISLAEDVIRLVGARARFMDPAEHDGLIAATEGLPALLGVGMFYMLLQSEGWMELRRMVNPALALTMQSLRAQTSKDLRALITTNRDNLARHLETLIGTLDQLHDLIADKDKADQIEVLLDRVQSEWEKWDVKRTSGQWEEIKQPDDLGPMGLMGGFLSFGALGGRRKKDQDDDE
jgi:prephenate dehydrogenase